MIFGYERKDNVFIISDKKQSFSVSGEDIAEFSKLVNSMRMNFALNKEIKKEENVSRARKNKKSNKS